MDKTPTTGDIPSIGELPVRRKDVVRMRVFKHVTGTTAGTFIAQERQG